MHESGSSLSGLGRRAAPALFIILGLVDPGGLVERFQNLKLLFRKQAPCAR
jgi:hypothetical protein